MLVSICLFHQATDSVAAVFQLITLFMCALLACFPSGFPLLDEGKNTKEHVPSQPDSTDSSLRSPLGTTKCQTEQPQHTMLKSPLMVYKAGEYPATSASESLFQDGGFLNRSDISIVSVSPFNSRRKTCDSVG